MGAIRSILSKFLPHAIFLLIIPLMLLIGCAEKSNPSSGGALGPGGSLSVSFAPSLRTQCSRLSAEVTVDEGSSIPLVVDCEHPGSFAWPTYLYNQLLLG